VKVPPGSTPGKLQALAVANGLCPAAPPPTVDVRQPNPLPLAPSADDIPVNGSAAVDGPTIGVCVVPNLKGDTISAAKAAIEAAGCILGTVKNGGPGNPADLGKVINQGPPAAAAVPLGTTVDITVGGPLCVVPALAGLTPDQAQGPLADAGCKLGTVTTGPTGNPNDAGKITSQNPPAGNEGPVNTKVDVVIAPPISLSAAAGPSCTVPDVSGLSESDARAKVEAAGCVLTTNQQDTSNPAQVGKVMAQSPAAGAVLPQGSPVNVTLGVQVLGETVTRPPASLPNTGTAPSLARTGGVVAGGLALWLLIGGLLTQLAGSERLWRLARRLKG
jgi:serine/threonine-protein kinase